MSHNSRGRALRRQAQDAMPWILLAASVAGIYLGRRRGRWITVAVSAYLANAALKKLAAF